MVLLSYRLLANNTAQITSRNFKSEKLHILYNGFFKLLLILGDLYMDNVELDNQSRNDLL